MTAVTRLFNDAEMAAAAYADLLSGPMDNDLNRTALSAAEGGGMSLTQVEKFATRYPTAVAQYDDAKNGTTSFSATIFKNTVANVPGSLTLAFRGTREQSGTPNDLTTDLDIFNSGAGYDQIVAMANWWRKVSAAEETIQMGTGLWVDEVVVLGASDRQVSAVVPEAEA